jgi:ribosomal protein S17E
MGVVMVRPAKGKRTKNEIKRIAQEIIDEYVEVFQKLAK